MANLSNKHHKLRKGKPKIIQEIEILGWLQKKGPITMPKPNITKSEIFKKMQL